MTELDVKLTPASIPSGCICGYTWGADGSPVRNGADVTGLTLNDMMADARTLAARDCPGGEQSHEAVRVGAFAAESGAP